MAGIFGAALALTVPEIAEKLDGQVVFFATPAEEYGEIGFKNELRAQGKIKYGVENVSCFVSAHLMILIFVLHITLHRGMTS